MLRLRILLPQDLRVLYRQFLLRVIDLEALSVHADVARFFGQFASILVFMSLVGALGLLFSGDNFTADRYLPFMWEGEQNLVSGTMLLVGLISVVGWDSTFPDRRDVMVLSPLPIAPRTILFAKVAAWASILGLAVVTLNFATGIAWPLFIGAHHRSVWGILQAFGAYWLTMVAASLFLYCSVLGIQGITSLLLPRRLFLWLSAFLQVAGFFIVLAVYFLQPTITSFPLAGSGNSWARWSPPLWFFAFFNQLNGSLPPGLNWAAQRAWVSLVLAISGGIVAMGLCYLRTMRKTLEEPDLVPGRHGFHWAPRLGSPLRTAVVLFSFRSIVRSRQHRLALAVYAAVTFSVAFLWVRMEVSSPTPLPLTSDFIATTFVILSLAVIGLRGMLSLPISLTANWILRTTQLFSTDKYVAATRWAMLLLGVAPAWLIVALLSVRMRPLHQIIIHLIVLGFLGGLLAEVSLVNFYKVPFTCSWLPGKVHIQVLFWCSVILVVAFALAGAELELPALSSLARSSLMILVMVLCCFALLRFNNHRAKSAQLYFEELPPEVITTLGIATLPQTKSTALSS